MKAAVKSALNSLLSPLGLEVMRKRAHEEQYADSRRQYAKLVEEFEGCFREQVFPDLPARERRVELIGNLLGTQPAEALYLVAHLNKSLGAPGDICEFGVAQGATSALMANEIRHTDKSLWLFDSFKGLPKPTAEDVLIDDIFNLGSMEKYEGKMASGVEEVMGRLKAISFPLSRVKVVPGFIEETIGLPNLPERVCFAYVDFDFYEPILTALTFLDQHLSAGGSVVVDDYGFFSAGAKTAVDEFAAEHQARYTVSLPPAFAGHFAILTKTA